MRFEGLKERWGEWCSREAVVGWLMVSSRDKMWIKIRGLIKKGIVMTGSRGELPYFVEQVN